VDGKDNIQFLSAMQHRPVCIRIGYRLSGELGIVLFHVLGKEGLASFNAGDARCLQNGLAQYVAPVARAHGPGIHSIKGRPSLLLSWPRKKEESPKSAKQDPAPGSSNVKAARQ